MNHAWMLDKVSKFIDLPAEASWNGDREAFETENEDEIEKQSYVVQQILDVATPEWRQEASAHSFGQETTPNAYVTRVWAVRAKGVLELGAELDDALGDDFPVLSAESLHPWVWEPAASLWANGHYRAAIQTAAQGLISNTQAKVDRWDISDRALFQESLSMKVPEAGKPRLRVRDEDGSDTYKSAQEGAMHYAVGVSMGIRNLAVHGTAAMDEQEAFEQLAALSVLARWVDRAALVSGPRV